MARTNERVITLGEILSVGPIWQLHSKTGLEARFDWMNKIIKEEFDYQEYKREYLEAVDQIEHIPKDIPVIIWISENASEQTGLRYVLYLLKDKTNQIKIINTTKIYEELFSRYNVQYIVKHTGEITTENFRTMYERAAEYHPLKQIERSQLEEEWMNLAENSDTLRIWLNGRIQSVPEDYYDQYMIERVKKLHHQHKNEEYIKSARVIGEVLGNIEQHLGDQFIEYRLKMLIEKGIFEVGGDMKAMRFYSVKII